MAPDRAPTSPAQRCFITPEGGSPQPACQAKPITGRTLPAQGVSPAAGSTLAPRKTTVGRLNGRPFYGQAKGQLRPTCTSYAGCAHQPSGILASTALRRSRSRPPRSRSRPRRRAPEPSSPTGRSPQRWEKISSAPVSSSTSRSQCLFSASFLILSASFGTITLSV